MRFCKYCNIEKTEDSFRKRKDGRNHFRCIECQNKKSAEWRENNRELHRQLAENWRCKNKERAAEKTREYLRNNREKLRLKSKQYRMSNPEKWREIKKKSIAKNRDKYLPRVNAASKAYKIKKRHSIKYLTKELKNAVYNLYKEAKYLQKTAGIEYQVDHIIPLNNDKVCGLHVPWNLQIITKKENLFKTNIFDGTYNNDSWRLKYGHSISNK